MKHGPRYHVKPSRHRQGITDYRRRIRLIKSKKPRIVVRKSLKNIRVQFVEYNSSGDKIITSAISSDLFKNYKWKYSISSVPAAYLTGLMAGVKAKQKGINEGVLDIGRYRPTVGNKLFATLKGVVDAGINCPHDETMIPSEERLYGKHINKEISTSVESIKNKITGGK